MKLWDKNISTEEKILQFTTGLDPQFDKLLAPYDILGSMAHVIMLSEIDLLDRQEAQTIVTDQSNQTLRITASFGVGTCRPDSEDGLDDLIKRTDEAMYEAKNSGRNRVCLAREE